MKTYEFSIIASGLDPESDSFETALYDNGCDDATVAFQRGHIILDFARDADSLEDAICSAVEDAIKAGCKIERLEPDPLVNLADIAARTGMSRAAITNYSKGHRGDGFPAPSVRVTSENPLWAWADVARWLFRNSKIERDQVLEAEAVRQANGLLDCGCAVTRAELKKRVQEQGQTI